MSMHEDVISAIILWIENNIHNKLTINDIAQRSGYSKWHFQRIFKEVTGENIASYIRKKKLSYAARDLDETYLSVGIISDRYGFENQQSFTRCFAREYNSPPARYRRSKKM